MVAWSPLFDLNESPPEYKTGALPDELSGHDRQFVSRVPRRSWAAGTSPQMVDAEGLEPSTVRLKVGYSSN